MTCEHWFWRFRREKSSVFQPCIWSWDRSKGTELGHWTWLETRTTHHQWIGMQRKNQDSEYTTREVARQDGVRRTTESDSGQRRCSALQICMHETFVFGPRQMGPRRNREAFGPENEWTLWIRLHSTTTCSAISGWKTRAALRFRRQEHVEKITVFVDSDFAGDPVSPKARRDWLLRLVTILHKLDLHFRAWQLWALEKRNFTQWWLGRRRREEREEERGQVGLSLRSTNMDLGIPMKVEIHRDNSTENSVTDRLGVRTEHIDTRYFWVQERVQDGDLTIKRVRTAKNCPDVGMQPVLASELKHHCKFAGLVFCWPRTPHSTSWYPRIIDISVDSCSRRRCRTENRNRQLSTVVVIIENGAKLSETLETVERLSTSHDEWTMMGEEDK